MRVNGPQPQSALVTNIDIGRQEGVKTACSHFALITDLLGVPSLKFQTRQLPSICVQPSRHSFLFTAVQNHMSALHRKSRGQLSLRGLRLYAPH